MKRLIAMTVAVVCGLMAPVAASPSLATAAPRHHGICHNSGDLSTYRQAMWNVGHRTGKKNAEITVSSNRRRASWHVRHGLKLCMWSVDTGSGGTYNGANSHRRHFRVPKKHQQIVMVQLYLRRKHR